MKKMDNKFNMDSILGYSKLSDAESLDFNSNIIIASDDLNEDKMLPDSSLSPGLLISDSSVDVIHRIMVYDRNGQHYYAHLKDLQKIKNTDTLGSCSDVFSPKSIAESLPEHSVNTDHNFYQQPNPPQQYNSTPQMLYFEKSVQTDNTAPMMCHVCNTINYNNLSESICDNDSNRSISSALLCAIEISKLTDRIELLEQHINSLSIDCFRNSADNLLKGNSNLQYSTSQWSTNYMDSQYQVNYSKQMEDFKKYEAKDIDLLANMCTIYDKHGNTKKLMKMADRKLTQLERSRPIIDFSSQPSHQLPVPHYVDPSKSYQTNSSTIDNASLRSSTDLNSDLSEILLPTSNFNYRNIPKKYKLHSFRQRSQQIQSEESDSCDERSPPTPDLRKAELDINDISEGIRVLVLMTEEDTTSINGNFQSNSQQVVPFTSPFLRAGTIVNNQGGFWRVRLDSIVSSNDSVAPAAVTSSRRQEILTLSESQLMEQSAREVIPTSLNQLQHGTRVCASWSSQLPLYLYPGTVDKHLINHNKVSIDFDDGDHRDIDLHKVRLLPENFSNLNDILFINDNSNINNNNIDNNNNNIAGTTIYEAEACFPVESKNEAVLSIKKEPSHRTSVASIASVSTTSTNKRKRKYKSNSPSSDVTKTEIVWTLYYEPATCEQSYFIRNVDQLRIQVEDNIQLLSNSKEVFVARVKEILARKQQPEMYIKCHWYYSIGDLIETSTKSNKSVNSKYIQALKKSKISKHLLFQSNHNDKNDIYCVVNKIQVATTKQFMSPSETDGGQSVEDNTLCQCINQCISSAGTSTSVPSSSTTKSHYKCSNSKHIFIVSGVYNYQNQTIEHLDPLLIQYIDNANNKQIQS